MNKKQIFLLSIICVVTFFAQGGEGAYHELAISKYPIERQLTKEDLEGPLQVAQSERDCATGCLAVATVCTFGAFFEGPASLVLCGAAWATASWARYIQTAQEVTDLEKQITALKNK